MCSQSRNKKDLRVDGRRRDDDSQLRPLLHNPGISVRLAQIHQVQRGALLQQAKKEIRISPSLMSLIDLIHLSIAWYITKYAAHHDDTITTEQGILHGLAKQHSIRHILYPSPRRGRKVLETYGVSNLTISDIQKQRKQVRTSPHHLRHYRPPRQLE